MVLKAALLVDAKQRSVETKGSGVLKSGWSACHGLWHYIDPSAKILDVLVIDSWLVIFNKQIPGTDWKIYKGTKRRGQRGSDCLMPNFMQDSSFLTVIICSIFTQWGDTIKLSRAPGRRFTPVEKWLHSFWKRSACRTWVGCPVLANAEVDAKRKWRTKI